jgi:hypothetical protein
MVVYPALANESTILNVSELGTEVKCLVIDDDDDDNNNNNSNNSNNNNNKDDDEKNSSSSSSSSSSSINDSNDIYDDNNNNDNNNNKNGGSGCSSEPTMTPGKDGIVLTIGDADGKSAAGTKLDLPSVESLRAEPAIVKKIAGKEGSDPYPQPRRAHRFDFGRLS